MVTQFVSEDVLYGSAYLFHRAAAHLDRAVVDADLVRKNEAIVAGALGLGNAVIKAQKLGGMTYASPSHGLSIGPLFDHHFDVIQSFLERLGQTVQCLRHETFKDVSVHVAYYSMYLQFYPEARLEMALLDR